MTAIWPASLPQYPLVAGYAEAGESGLLRTEMDAGPAKTRRRFTAGVRNLTHNLYLTKDQVETLDAFFGATLKRGALPFEWAFHRKDQTTGLAGFSTALVLSGGQYAEAPDGAHISFGAATSNHFSMEFWFEPKVSTAAPQGLLSKLNPASGLKEYAIFVESGGTMQFRAYDDIDGDTVFSNTISSAFPDTGWHHWAWTSEGANSRVYRDGVLLDTTAKITGDLQDTAAKLWIGRAGDGVSDHYADGMIADVRLWNENRTGAEIAAAMSAQLVGNETDLVAYYQFAEGQGITTEDLTSNDNHAVLVDAAFIPEVVQYRFRQPPTYSTASGDMIWSATCELEVLP